MALQMSRRRQGEVARLRPLTRGPTGRGARPRPTEAGHRSRRQGGGRIALIPIRRQGVARLQTPALVEALRRRFAEVPRSRGVPTYWRCGHRCPHSRRHLRDAGADRPARCNPSPRRSIRRHSPTSAMACGRCRRLGRRASRHARSAERGIVRAGTRCHSCRKVPPQARKSMPRPVSWVMAIGQCRR